MILFSVEKQTWLGYGLVHIFSDFDKFNKCIGSFPINNKEELKTLKEMYPTAKIKFQN